MRANNPNAAESTLESTTVEPPKSAGSVGMLAWYGLCVLMFTTLFALVIRQMLSLIAPSLQASMGYSDLQLGMLQGLGMAAFACVASFPMGWLADRYGRRLMLALGVALWSLATFVFAFQDGFTGLFLCTIGIAIGEAGLVPIVYAMIPDLFPERQRHVANLIFYGGSVLGGGLGMALGGSLLEWLAVSSASLPSAIASAEDWRIAMALVALPGALLFLLVATMPMGRQTSAIRASVAAEPSAPFMPYVARHWRSLATVFSSLLCVAIASGAIMMWFPLALPRAFGIDPATVGVGLGQAVVIASIVGILLPGVALKVGQRLGGLQPIKVATIFNGLACLPAMCLPFISSPLQAYIIVATQGAILVASSALMPGVIQDLAPPHLRSRVLSLLGIMNGLALAISPLAVGVVSGLITGPRGLLYSITLVGLPSLVGAAILLMVAWRPYAETLSQLQTAHSGEAS